MDVEDVVMLRTTMTEHEAAAEVADAWVELQGQKHHNAPVRLAAPRLAGALDALAAARASECLPTDR